MKVDRRKIRYVTLSWTYVDGDPELRYNEANYPEDTVGQVLESIYERGVKVVYVEDKEFPLTCYDDVFKAHDHAKASLEARKRRR